MTRLTGDVARVEDSMVAWFTVLVPEVLTLAGMVVVVLAVDLTLGLAALAVAPPLALVVALRRRRIGVAQRTSRDADAALAVEATEVLRNVRVVQAFTREPEAQGRFGGCSRGAVRAALGAMDLEARWSPVADLVLAAGGGLVLWLGVTAVAGGRMSLGTLLVVLAYLSSLYGPIRALARLARTLARGAASRERILEVLDSGEVVPDAPDPIPTLPLRRGLALLVRFYDPDAGAVELDGVDLRRLELASLRRQIALVPQDPWMLDGTVADNVAFGRPGATAEELGAAAHAALVDELIDALPDGWSTQVGEAGCGCRAGSGAGWPWPGRSCVTPRCCCWTSRPAGWTPPPSGRCWTAAGWSSRALRPSCAGRRRGLRPPLGPPAPARACTDRHIRRGVSS